MNLCIFYTSSTGSTRKPTHLLEIRGWTENERDQKRFLCRHDSIFSVSSLPPSAFVYVCVASAALPRRKASTRAAWNVAWIVKTINTHVYVSATSNCMPRVSSRDREKSILFISSCCFASLRVPHSFFLGALMRRRKFRFLWAKMSCVTRRRVGRMA